MVAATVALLLRGWFGRWGLIDQRPLSSGNSVAVAAVDRHALRTGACVDVPHPVYEISAAWLFVEAPRAF
jgi:hypothetical protein